MSLDSDLEFTALGLKWKVEAFFPNMSKPNDFKYSSEFTFRGKKCCLAYYFYQNCHRLALQKLELCEDPFDAAVDVENGTGQVLPELKSEKHLRNKNDSYPLLWCKTEANILRAYPEFSRDKHQLRFRVLLKEASRVKEKNSVAIQTEYSIPEGLDLSCVESLLEDFQQMMVQDSDLDVEFRCADQSFKAHGAVVCARSPVICSMLGSDIVEGRTRIVNIPNMTPDVFQLFLGYLYTGKLPEVSFEVVLSLYESGDYYKVLSLVRRCRKYLLQHLTVQNACDVLVIANAHSDKYFAEKVIAYMLETKVPQTSDRWSAFSDDHPKLANEVLKRGWDVFLK